MCSVKRGRVRSRSKQVARRWGWAWARTAARLPRAPPRSVNEVSPAPVDPAGQLGAHPVAVRVEPGQEPLHLRGVLVPVPDEAALVGVEMLGFAGAQRLGETAPGPVQGLVGEFDEPAEVGGGVRHEVRLRQQGVAVPAVAALQQAEPRQGVEEVGRHAGVHAGAPNHVVRVAGPSASAANTPSDTALCSTFAAQSAMVSLMSGPGSTAAAVVVGSSVVVTQASWSPLASAWVRCCRRCPRQVQRGSKSAEALRAGQVSGELRCASPLDRDGRPVTGDR